jgi:hypothetical protein
MIMASAYYDTDSEGMVYWVKPQSGPPEDVYDSDIESDSGESSSSDDTLMSCEISGA